MKCLVIVESPSKCKIITNYLNSIPELVSLYGEFTVIASCGHIRDLKKKELSIDIVNDFKPDYAIETGTYFGTSTIYLSGLVKEFTYTVEINEKYARIAKKRFEQNYSDLKIECILGDSKVEVRKILNTIPSQNLNVIAYLDAHWIGKVPTSTEIEELYNWGSNWVAIVDDFKVDSDLGYGFDVHDGVEVDSSTVPNLPGLQIWVPSEMSKLETGAKRGTAYIFTETSIDQMTQGTLANLQRIR